MHAAHLSSVVSGREITELCAEMHLCGAPKPLEDVVFMATRHEGGAPGTLMAPRFAPCNRGGLSLRVCGSEGGVERGLENADRLTFNRFREPDRVLTRGH